MRHPNSSEVDVTYYILYNPLLGCRGGEKV